MRLSWSTLVCALLLLQLQLPWNPVDSAASKSRARGSRKGSSSSRSSSRSTTTTSSSSRKDSCRSGESRIAEWSLMSARLSDSLVLSQKICKDAERLHDAYTKEFLQSEAKSLPVSTAIPTALILHGCPKKYKCAKAYWRTMNRACLPALARVACDLRLRLGALRSAARIFPDEVRVLREDTHALLAALSRQEARNCLEQASSPPAGAEEEQEEGRVEAMPSGGSGGGWAQHAHESGALHLVVHRAGDIARLLGLVRPR